MRIADQSTACRRLAVRSAKKSKHRYGKLHDFWATSLLVAVAMMTLRKQPVVLKDAWAEIEEVWHS